MVTGKSVQVTGKSQSTRKHVGKSTSAPSPAQQPRKSTSSSFTIPACCSCGVVITEDTKALQCDRCLSHDTWKCAPCLNLTGDVYDCLVSNTNDPRRWFCDGCEKQVMDRNYTVPTHQSDKLDHLITAIEKLMNRYEDVEKQLANKCSISDASKLEERINQLEQRLASHENEVAPKLTELQDKMMTTALPHSVEKENGISDKDLIKFVVQEEINKKNQLRRKTLKAVSETSLSIAYLKRNQIMFRREKLAMQYSLETSLTEFLMWKWMTTTLIKCTG